MKIKGIFKKFGSKANIKLFTILTIVVFIILTTLTNVGLDGENFNFSKWIINTILSITISIAGLLLGESLASDCLKSKEDGLYQTTLQTYNTLYITIMPIIIYFNDFLLWFKDKETFNKQLDYLLSRDIKEARDIIKELQLDQVDELLEHPIQLESGKIIRKKTEEQVQAIKKVLEGKIVVQSSSGNYYLNAFENHSKKSVLEEGKQIEKETNIFVTISRTRKILLSIFISIVFATITFSQLANTPIIVALTNLVLRLCTFVSCLYCGWQTESVVVKELAKKIENKIKVLSIFKTSYNSGEFKPTEYEDLARQEYEEYINQIENTTIEEIIIEGE